jgi:hypothetical protein
MACCCDSAPRRGERDDWLRSPEEAGYMFYVQDVRAMRRDSFATTRRLCFCGCLVRCVNLAGWGCGSQALEGGDGQVGERTGSPSTPSHLPQHLDHATRLPMLVNRQRDAHSPFSACEIGLTGSKQPSLSPGCTISQHVSVVSLKDPDRFCCSPMHLPLLTACCFHLALVESLG